MQTLPLAPRSLFRDRGGIADWRGWLPTAIELALLLLLAVQAARLLWLALMPIEPIGASTPADDTVATTPRLPAIDIFFRQMTVARTGNGSGEALGYTLFGVHNDSEGDGSAILGKNDDQASYAVGDAITSGIVLESVGADHAVLLASGVRHRIELPRHAEATTRPAPTTLPVGAPKPTTTTTPTVDPQALLAEAGLRENVDGGYTLIPRGDGALLRQVGLKSGDVLLSVNGRPLDPERLGALKDELKGQSQLTIEYQRDGQTHTTKLKAPR